MIFKNRQHHISPLILITILTLTNHQNGQHGHSNEHEHDYDRGPGWGPQDHRLLPSDGWAENFLYLFRKLKPPFIDFIYWKLHTSSSCIQNFSLDLMVRSTPSNHTGPGQSPGQQPRRPLWSVQDSAEVAGNSSWSQWNWLYTRTISLWLQQEWRLVITKIFPQSRTEP